MLSRTTQTLKAFAHTTSVLCSYRSGGAVSTPESPGQSPGWGLRPKPQKCFRGKAKHTCKNQLNKQLNMQYLRTVKHFSSC